MLIPVATAAVLSVGFGAGTAHVSNRLAAAERLAADDLRHALLPPGALLVGSDPGSQAAMVSSCRPVVDDHEFYAASGTLSNLLSFYRHHLAKTATSYSEWSSGGIVGYSDSIPQQRNRPVDNLMGYYLTRARAGRILIRVDARVAPEGASCAVSGSPDSRDPDRR